MSTTLNRDSQNYPSGSVFVPGVGVINLRGGTTNTDINNNVSADGVMELAVAGQLLNNAGADGNALANVLIIALGGFNGATVDREYLPSVYKNVAAVAVTASTPVAIWTPATGKKFHLMGWNLSLSVAGSIIFKDGGNSSAEIIRAGAMPIGQANVSPWFGNGFTGAAAAGALQIDVTASGTVNGFVFGVEF